MSFPCFSLVATFNLSALYVLHTKSTRATSQKVDITYRFKTLLIYCSKNSVSPYTFKHLNKAPSKMTTQTPCVKSFTGGTIASKPVSSFTKYEAFQAYPHCLMFGYGSFTGCETLETIRSLTDLKTVHQQTVL